jgi:acetyltransferase-like isoleucine patch superfamily enzyme
MSRAAVEKLNGFLWLNKKGEPAGRYPDASLWGRIKNNIAPNDIVIASSRKSSGGFLVDIKTGVNLNGYPKVKRNAAPPVHEILEGALIDQVKEIMSVTPEPETTIEIGEKSIVDFESDIGPRTNIGEYTIIGNRVKIGKNCKIGNHVIIENGVDIGPNTIINNFVELKPGTEKIKIGKGCLIDSRVMIEGNCIIGDRSIVGPSCEIKSGVILEEDAQLQGRNRLANNCYVEQGALIKYGSILTSNVRIGKDCFIGPNVIMTGDDTSRSQSEAGNQLSTSIGARTFVGANTIFMPSVHVGEDCLIGASSFVRDNTNNNEVWFGNPAKLRRKKEDK